MSSSKIWYIHKYREKYHKKYLLIISFLKKYIKICRRERECNKFFLDVFGNKKLLLKGVVYIRAVRN